MTNNLLTLFCLVDGESTSFPVKIESTETIGGLKKAIKDENSIAFADVDAKMLSLWRVSIPVPEDDDNELPILLNNIVTKDKKKLGPTTRLSKVFPAELPDETIHIIVQRPPPVHTPIAVPLPVRARSSTPFSDDSRPGTPLSGDLRTDIKKITDKFFAQGSRTTDFLDSFVRGVRRLPVTAGPIAGLPRAWRRGYGMPSESRPSLLFLDLPDPSNPVAESRNHASASILDMGCGKTRAVIELLSQHWGFYFNASSDDWGSSDMITLHSTVRDHLKDTRGSFIIDRQSNNTYARKTALLLFLSRLLIFRYCLNVSNSRETFTSARWTLLQVCPHVLYKDIFNTLFRQIRKLRHHAVSDLTDMVCDLFEKTKQSLIQHGGLPKINDDTRLLVVHDEAQFLGDEFNGDFQSMSSSDESPRPLLSPILHAFRDVGDDQLTLVTCGTGLSVNTLFWVQSSGSGLKDSSTNFKYMEFPGWTGHDSVNVYISRIRKCLENDESQQILHERLPSEAVDMLVEKLVGRYRPIAVAIEKIIEGNEHGPWKFAIEDTEAKLVSWTHRHIKGNLCYEISRLHDKHNKYKDQLVESIDSILALLMYQRCMFGNHDLILKEVDPQLVEHAFGRIRIVQGRTVTVIDEPFVSKAVENYFAANDPYFQKCGSAW
ncbi:hypothetical protein BGX26_004416 [Mortierella sp. AD094]|nr:hypothetical protein BGX26_004416 [Mortierella sp. AD094]